MINHSLNDSYIINDKINDAKTQLHKILKFAIIIAIITLIIKNVNAIILKDTVLIIS